VGLSRIDWTLWDSDRWLTGFLLGQRGLCRCQGTNRVMDEEAGFIVPRISAGGLPMTVPV